MTSVSRLIEYFTNAGGPVNPVPCPCIIYLGQSYNPLSGWFRVGFLVSVYHRIIWFILGLWMPEAAWVVVNQDSESWYPRGHKGWICM